MLLSARKKDFINPQLAALVESEEETENNQKKFEDFKTSFQATQKGTFNTYYPCLDKQKDGRNALKAPNTSVDQKYGAYLTVQQQSKFGSNLHRSSMQNLKQLNKE